MEHILSVKLCTALMGGHNLVAGSFYEAMALHGDAPSQALKDKTCTRLTFIFTRQCHDYLHSTGCLALCASEHDDSSDLLISVFNAILSRIGKLAIT